MTASQSNLVELAKQGNTEAIASLMNRHLHAKGITARAVLKDGNLQVMLEASEAPDQEMLVDFIYKGIAGLKSNLIENIIIYGKQTGVKLPAWSRTVNLQQSPSAQANPRQEKVDPLSDRMMQNSVTEKSLKQTSVAEKVQQKRKLFWYETESPLIIVALLIIFFPLGLWSMWKYSTWSLKHKALITTAFATLVLVNTSGRTPSTSTSIVQTTTITPKETQPEQKTVVLAEAFSTPIGSFPVTKYAGDSCLYARATTAHTSYYGMSELKSLLKQQYGVTCVLWSD